MRRVLLVIALCVAVTGCKEPAPKSMELYKNGTGSVKLTVEKTDGGAYLSLHGMGNSIDMDEKQAAAVAEVLGKFDDFRVGEKAEETVLVGDVAIRFEKDPTGTRTTIASKNCAVELLKKDIDAILTQLRNAGTILEKARR